MALLDEQERELQDAMLRGPPPLGPGAPARERVYAFLSALVALTDANADILLASETVKVGARYRTGAYSAWRQHLALLLGEARPELDAPVVAHLLLAPLAAESYDQLRRIERRSLALPGQRAMRSGSVASQMWPGRARRRSRGGHRSQSVDVADEQVAQFLGVAERDAMTAGDLVSDGAQA